MDKHKNNSGLNVQEFDPFEFLSEIWIKKHFIIICSLISIFFGGVYLNFTTFKHVVIMKVTPTLNNSSNNTSTSRLDGIASQLIGIDSESEPTNFKFYKSLISSRIVADKISNNIDILKVIFPGEWNEKNKSWIIPENTFSTNIKNLLKGILGVPVYKHKIPNTDRVQEYLSRNIFISKSGNDMITNIQMISNETKRSIFILKSVHHFSDEVIRKRSLNQTNAYIDFLNESLSDTTNKDQRASIISTLSSQYKIKMLADSNLPFAAELFGSPFASAYYVEPKPKVVLVSFLVLGIFIGVLVIFIRFIITLRRRVG